jgi:hypothetical protein
MLKILYATANHMQDYLSDCILHGLQQLEHVEVIDEPYCWYMYKNSFINRNIKDLYGRGFTIFGTLPDNSTDRTDILEKVKHKYFDYIVLARVSCVPSFIEEVFKYYNKNNIIILDGEDDCVIRTQYYGCGIYFKRELQSEDPKIFPISFGFPKEKIQKPLSKIKVLADYEPNGTRAYTYDNEQDYYDDYNRSYFGKTWRKAGWDCLRHYEILGSACVPYFVDIDSCPKRTCTNLPKELLLTIKNLCDAKGPDWVLTSSGQDMYLDFKDKILDHFINNGTTDQIAKKLLDTVQQHK